jgi:hypothetical protein
VGILCCVSGLSISMFGPDMVLNQRQVLVIVSDWEPYQAKHRNRQTRQGCLGFRTFNVFVSLFMYSVFIN